jgi:mRNA interferase MazF
MVSPSGKPNRGEVWLVQLDPVVGHEQGGRRPALIISADPFNHSPADLVVVILLTSRSKNQPMHVAMTPPEGGLTAPNWLKVEDVRPISTQRLVTRWGVVGAVTVNAVETNLRRLLNL